MRIVTMLAVAACAGLLWAGACLAIGMPVAVTVAGAVLGAIGGLVAAAICLVGASAEALELELEEADVRRSSVVAFVRDDRFSRDEAPSPTKDRVA